MNAYLDQCIYKDAFKSAESTDQSASYSALQSPPYCRQCYPVVSPCPQVLCSGLRMGLVWEWLGACQATLGMAWWGMMQSVRIRRVWPIVIIMYLPVLDDWHLAIDQVQMKDEGMYQCQVGAGEMVGPVMSEMVTITVMVKPSVPRILQGEEIEVMEGREVVLECQVEGRPQPEVNSL